MIQNLLSFIYRGHSSNEAKVFRADYARLAELRAFLPSNIPVVALTATATAQVRKGIISNLAMTNTHIIEGSPNRENIKYIVIDSFCNKIHESSSSWSWLTSRLNSLQANTPRIIIYCRSRSQCTGLYGIFKSAVDSQTHYAMYHAATATDVQLEIVKDFENETGVIRVLFATIAFGMGVNVRGVHTIMHLGVPSDIDDYIQESGRGGRDGKQSVSILVKYRMMYTGSKVTTRMKAFVNNTDTCRRKILLEHFNIQDHVHSQAAHTCCDVCAVTCMCGGDDRCQGMQACQEETNVLLHLGFQHPDKADIAYLARRQVTADQREELKEKLLSYRETLLEDDASYLAGGDITCGLPLSTVDKITLECAAVMPYDVFCHRYAIYSDSITNSTWAIVQDTLQECEILDTGGPDDPQEDDNEADDESAEYPNDSSAGDDEDNDNYSSNYYEYMESNDYHGDYHWW